MNDKIPTNEKEREEFRKKVINLFEEKYGP